MLSGTTRPTASPRMALSLTVMALAVPAIFCTVALPAYAAHNAAADASTVAGADATAQLDGTSVKGALTVEKLPGLTGGG